MTSRGRESAHPSKSSELGQPVQREDDNTEAAAQSQNRSWDHSQDHAPGRSRHCSQDRQHDLNPADTPNWVVGKVLHYQAVTAGPDSSRPLELKAQHWKIEVSATSRVPANDNIGPTATTNAKDSSTGQTEKAWPLEFAAKQKCDMIRCASLVRADQLCVTALQCAMPKHRERPSVLSQCPGLIALRRNSSNDCIEWLCTDCNRFGSIATWRSGRHDLTRFARAHLDLAGEQRFALSPENYWLLRRLQLVDGEGLRLIFSAIREEHVVCLHGSVDEWTTLLESIRAEASFVARFEDQECLLALANQIEESVGQLS